VTHLSQAELLRWRDEGRAEDRERVLSHLARCRTCAAELAELTRRATIDPATAGDAADGGSVHFDPADFVKRGYAVRREVNAGQAWRGDARVERAPIWTSRKLWAGALGAVAMLALVVTLMPGERERGGDAGGDVVRGGGITITSPDSPAETPQTIAWTSGVKAARYRVELLDASGAAVFQTTTTDTRVVLRGDQVPGLIAGRSYVLKITALDMEGESITSASKTFSVAGRGGNGSGAK
jgi:hypothetical protein